MDKYDEKLSGLVAGEGIVDTGACARGSHEVNGISCSPKELETA